jgi:thiamine transport system ATP-binding protein
MLTFDHLVLEQDQFRLEANLTIPPGGIVAVIGPSGAGKSTFLSAIAGFVRPASGRILWMGLDMADQWPGERPLSILFQDQNLFPHLTVAQNAGLGIRPDLRLSTDQQARLRDALARVGLQGFGSRKPGSLSGGEQSRAALARALLRDRPLLLLDEPFTALGPALKAEMLDLVADLAAERGTTVLMVTHDPDDARRSAGRIVLVADGVVNAPMATADAFASPPPALKSYLGA